MAKPSAPAPSAPAAAPAPGPAKSKGTANVQRVAPERDVEVVEWGNGEELSATGAGPEGAQPRIVDGGEVTPQKGEPDYVEPGAKPKADEVGKDPPTDDIPTKVEAPPKQSAAEKRAKALAALNAENRARTLEAELKATQDKLAKADPTKLTLGEILKLKGQSKDDLLEKLLAGTDELDLPPKLEGTDAEVAALKKRLDDAEAKLKAREEADGQRQVAEAIRVVGETLKESDDLVPLVNSVSGAHERVLKEAYQDWTKAGSPGEMIDFVPVAAERVEAALRNEHPRLAKLVTTAKAKPTTLESAAAAVVAPARGITRRTAAQPNGKPTPLPDDVHDRDAAIKKEFGWG